MNNREVLDVAVRQSAIDLNCSPEDFFRGSPCIVRSKANPEARKYLVLPFECDLVFYGGNVVASVSERTEPIVHQYLNRFQPEHCFETPNLHVLDDNLRAFGLRTRHMAEYFLPDTTELREIPCQFPLKILCPEEFQDLYLPQWGNALCKDRKECDLLAVGAYDGEKLIGLAGASADCTTMWQIGIDVLPDYRRRGIAASLTSRLALEIFQRGKVPFYCAAWSNIASVRNAIRCGFRPAWAELTAKPIEEGRMELTPSMV